MSKVRTHPRRPVQRETPAAGLPVVALVGRPNVGKSALFNRIIGERKAVVEDLPGTTRDRLYAQTEWSALDFKLIDTGGYEKFDTGQFSALVREQVEIAVTEADVILFVVDAIHGVTAADQEIAQLLRQASPPVIVVANKADNEIRRRNTIEFYELGFGEPRAVSSLHGMGVADLLDEVVALLPNTPATDPDQATMALAIVGRPNVGKSTLLNAVLGEERAIVSDIPGTTRDAIDTVVVRGDRTLRLVDTAGIRRRGRIVPGVEKHSVFRAEDAIDRCDVAILLLDAPEGITAQDTHIAGYVADAAKGLVVAVNKWDAMGEEHQADRYVRWVLRRLKFVPWAFVCFISAKEGDGIEHLLDLGERAAEERKKRVNTGELNRVVQRAIAAHQPGNVAGKRARILYVTQAAIEPPTFVFFVNDPALLHFSYRRYLENTLREAFGFEGTAIRMIYRGREDASPGEVE